MHMRTFDLAVCADLLQSVLNMAKQRKTFEHKGVGQERVHLLSLLRHVLLHASVQDQNCSEGCIHRSGHIGHGIVHGQLTWKVMALRAVGETPQETQGWGCCLCLANHLSNGVIAKATAVSGRRFLSRSAMPLLL
jgi:hypothetical protein